MGRRSKLTPEARERFVAALRAGNFPEVAARLAGWSPATMYRYLADDSPGNDGFREEVERARVELEVRLVGTIMKAALSSAKWALELLARMFPERWGRGARSDPAGDDALHDAGVDPEQPVLLDPDLLGPLVNGILDALARLRSGPEAIAAVDAVAAFEEVGDDAGEPDEDEDGEP